MDISTEKAQQLAEKSMRIFTAFKNISERIAGDMSETAYGFTTDEKEVMSKMILKLIHACRTPAEIEDIFTGRSEHTDLVQQMDEINITGSIHVIDTLSKKYVTDMPHLNDFEFLNDEQIDAFAKAIAADEPMPEPEGDLMDLFPGLWQMSPFQQTLYNEADSFSMTNGGWSYPMTAESMLPDPFKEIIFHQNAAFDQKYGHLSHQTRLKVCQMAEDLIDHTKTREDTGMFFARPLNQKAQILPGIKEMSYEERAMLKDAAAYYFEYNQDHPGVIQSGIRKIGRFIGRRMIAPAHAEKGRGRAD